MLKKLLLVSILGLAIGCGSESIKDGVYNGVVREIDIQIIIKDDNLEYIDLKNDTTDYYSKIKDKNEDDEDIVYYLSEINKMKCYLGLKQTNESSLVVYPFYTIKATSDINNALLSYAMGIISIETINDMISINSVDINKYEIFEKVEN